MSSILAGETIFAAFYSSFDSQMAVRCIVASAVGFYSGILYKDKCLVKKCEVYAANPVVPVNPSQPVEINVDDHVSQTMQFGFPGVDTLLVKKSFILSYDRKNKVPHWVFEHLTPEHIAYNKDVNRSKSSFFEEDSIPVYFRSTNSDYKRCDFRRGHLAAAGNHRSKQEFIDDTFVLSNIAPQIADKKFEDNGWNKLEKHVREMVKQYKNVYVCTGPLYFPRMESDGKKYIKYQVIGRNNVAVPTHFFKVIAYEKEGSLFDIESYVIPNQTIDEVSLKSFLTSFGLSFARAWDKQFNVRTPNMSMPLPVARPTAKHPAENCHPNEARRAKNNYYYLLKEIILPIFKEKSFLMVLDTAKCLCEQIQ
ncbi:endonuclease G, mitochondrial [Caerostris extrusa]|uniref:Endonuclease G, mitochondrial n=1 Tax=Caerostris extrusa TaxID=172846 RepID=A0AAV4NVQ6_CAEEX|nr:endonuclease G, mitochondrial [Caerostris extrusa]